MHKLISLTPKHHTLQTYEAVPFLYSNPEWYINSTLICCEIIEDLASEIKQLKSDNRVLRSRVTRLTKQLIH